MGEENNKAEDVFYPGAVSGERCSALPDVCEFVRIGSNQTKGTSCPEFIKLAEKPRARGLLEAVVPMGQAQPAPRQREGSVVGAVF